MMNTDSRKFSGRRHGLKPILRLQWLLMVGVVCLFWYGVGSYGAEEEKESGEVVAVAGVDVAKVAALKAVILQKDIFRPAKISSVPVNVDVNETDIDTGPKPLKRPFRVIGIRSTDQGRLVDLYFENPPEVAQKKVGEVIEKTVTIMAIEATFLRCEYAGLEVRIEQGETSNDALARLRGQEESEYELIGTTLKGVGYVADIYLPRQERTRRIEVGEILGEATVMKIEKGRVTLIDPDGNQITISNE